MSRPSKVIRPSVGSISRVSIRPVVVLPQPDSPTSESVSPFLTVKSSPSTACTALVLRCSSPRRTGKYLRRPETASRARSPAVTVPVVAGPAVVSSFISSRCPVTGSG
jgi:hypothetical protein